MNKLYFGDNLEILCEMPDERVHFVSTIGVCNVRLEQA